MTRQSSQVTAERSAGERLACDPVRSYADFFYPFRFDPSTFAQRCEAIRSARPVDGSARARYWELERPQDELLLPHLADHLSPLDGRSPTAWMWRFDGSRLRSLRRWGAAPVAATSASREEWTLCTPRGEIRVLLEGVRLVLLKSGVGSVILSARPRERSFDAWLDFNHYFRFARGQRKVSLLGGSALRESPLWRAQSTRPRAPVVGRDDGGETIDSETIDSETVDSETVDSETVDSETIDNQTVDSQVADGAIADGATVHWLLGDTLDWLLGTACAQSEGERWWSDALRSGRLLPFVSMFLEGAAAKEVPRIVYRVRSFFNSAQRGDPGAELLAVEESALLPYGEGQWLFFSIEGGGFLGNDTPATPFFIRTLPGHLRSFYLMAFLLVLHQRLVLTGLLEDIANHWIDSSDDERVSAFEDIRNRFLDFSSREAWAHVMQHEHHHRAYRRWREALEVDRLYSEVAERIRDMHGAALQHRLREETRAARSLERTVGVVGAVIGFPAIVAAFLDIHLAGVLEVDDNLPFWAALSLVVLAAPIGGLILFLLRRRLGAVGREEHPPAGGQPAPRAASRR